VRESDEIHIVAAGNDDTNIKIRNGTLDIKVFIETRGNFERWRPRTKCEFPIASAALAGEVLRQLGVAVPRLSRESYTLNQFLAEVVLPHRELAAAAVRDGQLRCRTSGGFGAGLSRSMAMRGP